MEKYRNTQLENEKRLYPGVSYAEYMYFPEGQYPIIDDLSHMGIPIQEEFQYLATLNPRITTYSVTDLSNLMVPALAEQIEKYDSRVSMIFPGTGGSRLLQAMPSELVINPLFLDVKRIKNERGEKVPSMPYEQMVEYNYQIEHNPEIEAVIVVDDAINGGNTLTYMKNSCYVKPDIHWIAATPVLYSPWRDDKQRSNRSSVKGIDRIIAGAVFDGPTYPVDSNYLSSLLKRDIYTDAKIVNLYQEMSAAYQYELQQLLFTMQKKFQVTEV